MSVVPFHSVATTTDQTDQSRSMPSSESCLAARSTPQPCHYPSNADATSSIRVTNDPTSCEATESSTALRAVVGPSGPRTVRSSTAYCVSACFRGTVGGRKDLVARTAQWFEFKPAAQADAAPRDGVAKVVIAQTQQCSMINR